MNHEGSEWMGGNLTQLDLQSREAAIDVLQQAIFAELGDATEGRQMGQLVNSVAERSHALPSDVSFALFRAIGVELEGHRLTYSTADDIVRRV